MIRASRGSAARTRSRRPGTAVLAVAVAALVCAWPSPSLAEPPGGSDRKNQLGLYLWIPVLDGSSALGDLPSPIESSLSDFGLGGPFGYVRNPEPWGAIVTTIYLDVDSEFQTPVQGLAGKDSFEIFTADAVTNRRWGFNDDRIGVELLLGFRYWNMKQSRTIEGEPLDEGSASWGDGVVGGRVTVQLGKRWWFFGRLDGALGQSDNSWNADVAFQWRTSRLISLVLGYRLTHVNYESGSGSSKFEIDTDIGGPTMAFLFRF